jgi:hypothetical protein
MCTCAGCQWLTPVILATWETEIGRITVLGQQGQIAPETPISKITKATCAGGVAQAVEWLLCKCKALNSNPSPTKKNTETKKKMYLRRRKYSQESLSEIISSGEV